MPHRPKPHHRPTGRILVLTAVGVGLALLGACREPAGPPATLEAGALSFSYAGRLNGTFTADGRCYRSAGYPVADSACALALDLGDTVRLRAVRAPRTIRWIHVNVELPADGGCDGAETCRIAVDYLSRVGVVERSFRSSEAMVTIVEATEDRMRGTFSGRAHDPDGAAGDTIRIFDGTFDVPVVPR